MRNNKALFLTLAFALFAAVAVSSAEASSSPSPLSNDEIKYLQYTQDLQAPGALEISPTPVDSAEAELLSSMESASGLDPDAITAGSSLIDLIIIILLVYLVLRLLD